MEAYKHDDVVRFYEQEKVIQPQSSADTLYLESKCGDMGDRIK